MCTHYYTCMSHFMATLCLNLHPNVHTQYIIECLLHRTCTCYSPYAVDDMEAYNNTSTCTFSLKTNVRTHSLQKLDFSSLYTPSKDLLGTTLIQKVMQYNVNTSRSLLSKRWRTTRGVSIYMLQLFYIYWYL